MVELVTIKSNYSKGEINVDREFLVSEVIEKRNILILKDVFEKETLKKLRERVFRWGQNTESSNPSLDHFFDQSFHRLDDDPSKSKTKHIFHAYNITNEENIDFYAEVDEIFQPMKQLQEVLSDTTLVTTPGKNGIAVRPQFIHYPRGGGHFDWHIHPFLPQKVGLILSLSERGVDFQKGGTEFKFDDKVCSIELEHNIGDIALFRYDIEHRISEIDNTEELNFDSTNGKWSFILPFY